MPARNQQHEVRKVQPIRQARRQRMAGQMVDRDQRQARCGGQPARAHDARKHPADQSRPRRNGYSVKHPQSQTGSRERLFNAKVQLFDMRTCRNLGDDPAEVGMKIALPCDNRRQDAPPPPGRPHQGGGGIIAAAFDPEKGKLA